jgi:hypothetical protein
MIVNILKNESQLRCLPNIPGKIKRNKDIGRYSFELNPEKEPVLKNSEYLE